ncbi:zinc-ribbon domain-containing protein [bacterium]|nr:zinc-ribbon domain-containing protein [bacterium]
MKFHCDKCGKKYAISEDKLQGYGSTFKIRCQECKHIIVVTNPVSQNAPVIKKEWYIYLKNEQSGPHSFEEIRKFSETGELNFSTLVWRNGMSDWMQAQFIPELKNLIKLPIRTPERRANQSQKLKQLYDMSKSSSENSFDSNEKMESFSDEMEEMEPEEMSEEEVEEIKNSALYKVSLSSENINVSSSSNSAENKIVNSFSSENKTLNPLKSSENRSLSSETKKTPPQNNDFEDSPTSNPFISNKGVKGEEESSIFADDFFSKNYEEKIEDKDSRLLRSITGDNTFGNTGIFVMYNQKQRKERMLFLTIVTLLLVVGGSIVFYLYTREPAVKVVEIEKEVIKEKVKVVKEKEKVYIDVEKNSGTTIRNSNKSTSDSKTTDDIQKNEVKTDDNKNNIELYTLKTSDVNKRVDVAVKDDSVYSNKSSNKGYVASVAEMVESKKQGIMICFQKALKTEPNLIAKVKFTLSISSSGRVNDVLANFTPQKLDGSILSDCMVKKIKAWKFPANPDGGATEFIFKLSLQAQ